MSRGCGDSKSFKQCLRPFPSVSLDILTSTDMIIISARGVGGRRWEEASLPRVKVEGQTKRSEKFTTVKGEVVLYVTLTNHSEVRSGRRGRVRGHTRKGAPLTTLVVRLPRPYTLPRRSHI